MAWYLDRVVEKIFLVKDDQHEEIDSVEAGKMGKVEFTLKSGVKMEVALTDFQIDGGSFCEKFDGVLSSRTAFLTKWKKLCNEQENGKQNGNMTPGSVVDLGIKDKFLGTYDVHISNLKAPEGGRGTRDVDYSHVAHLEKSFKAEDMGQVVLLVGMMITDDLPRNLEDISETKLETLGGNHTRLALQSLFEKGLLVTPCVKVNVFKPLARTEALALGYQHNAVLEEKKKPMSFVDKVKLMRECRPREEMSSAEVAVWKDTLCVIFRAESRRKLQTNMAHHLQMARMSDKLFQKVMFANSQKQITDKFFKAMLRIDSEETYDQCLDILAAKGTAAFNTKVAEYIEQGLVRSRKKDKSDGRAASIQIGDGEEQENSSSDVKSLKEKVTALQTQNEKLLEELDRLREDNKRKREECLEVNYAENKKWKVGDVVDAKWKDKNFYAAEVQRVETVYHVVYTEDKKKARITAEDMKDRACS